MFKAFKSGLLVAALLTCAFAPSVQAQAAPAVAAAPTKPALWVIRDTDSTIYLFGSIHVMKEGTGWLTPELQSRFDKADDVWFEIPNLDDKAAAMPMAQKYMFDASQTMTDGLTPAEIARVDELLKPSGLNSQMLKPMRKWAVGLIITLQQITASGYATQTGVDLTLVARARESGQTVHGFETMESQLKALVPLSEEEELKSLRTTLNDVDTMAQDVHNLFDAWRIGDDERLTKLMIDKMKAEYPTGYQRMMVARNAGWTPQIETILAGKGTVFIAVGAGHLAGPDSVIAMLQKQGVAVERVAY